MSLAPQLCSSFVSVFYFLVFFPRAVVLVLVLCYIWFVLSTGTSNTVLLLQLVLITDCSQQISFPRVEMKSEAGTLCFSSIRYCGALDGVLAGHVTNIGSPEQKRLFHQFLSLSMSSGKYQVRLP